MANPSQLTALQPCTDSTSEILPDDDPHSIDKLSLLNNFETASSTRCILSYQYENGRRYHAYQEGEYLLPNDDREQDRLDMHHHQFRLILGGPLFRAPVDPSSGRILDLGTGTGIWAIEMADEYPHATIIGTDLSPIQPRWAPPNCAFEVDDFESEWDFAKPFDFIHARTLAGSVRDFPALYRRIIDNLKPGGWAQTVDFSCDVFSDDNTRNRAPNVIQWVNLLNEASIRFGKEMNVAHRHRQWMIDAGFKDVQEEIFRVPLNPWARGRTMKHLGRYQQAIMVEAMESYSLAAFTRVLGWSTEEVLDFFVRVRQELRDRSIHLYARFYYTYGHREECMCLDGESTLSSEFEED